MIFLMIENEIISILKMTYLYTCLADEENEKTEEGLSP